MATVTKKDIVDRIAEKLHLKQVTVKDVVQKFLDEIMHDLDHGHRLEFRDFGVFESRSRPARLAWNPRTLSRVPVSGKRKVRFKPGRLLKDRLAKPAPFTDGMVLVSKTTANPLTPESKP